MREDDSGDSEDGEDGELSCVQNVKETVSDGVSKQEHLYTVPKIKTT